VPVNEAGKLVQLDSILIVSPASGSVTVAPRLDTDPLGMVPPDEIVAPVSERFW